MNRTNIEQNDVFISWTSKDMEIKNRIVDFLRKNGITCTESDHSCAGDFSEWSREVVSKCTVFLLLYTENTTKSSYVPVEIEEFKKLDEYHNRCVPVVQSFELYEKHLPDLAERESAVFFKKREIDNNTVSYELTDELLEKILFNVQSLINNRFYKIYREATRPAYLRIASMLKSMRVADKELDYKKLYVKRTVKDADNNAVSDASEFIRAKDIFFLQGPAGSGKSSYIDEIREAADDKTLVMSLSCRKLTGKPDLFSFMFDEFTRHCANRHFYTTNDFRSLLSVRHLNLILDGMDEIATDEGKRAFLNMVSEYYKANADTTTLFFTGRNIEDADLIAMNGQSPKILFLQSFEEDQIKVFGENLFMLLGSAEKNNEFYIRIKDLSDEIRTNPLLLSQLMIVYEKTDKIPETVVGIYEAVCEITLANENEVSDVPEEYKTMITKSLSGILKHFSAERYRLQSQGKDVASVKIFASILKNKYDDARERAAFLEDYLKNRAIMKSDDSFYHKMLLEYFTAVYYYEKCFDSYGSEIEDEDTLRELFSHNTDAYWSDVLKLFLIKADSEIDGDTTTVLYNTLFSFGITEYSLFFDASKNLICHKKEALTALISDILKKSAEGIYPPYGPLFWYVPEFNLYEEVIASLDALKESDCFTKALALTRDVCWIFGHFNRISEISDKYDGTALFGKAQLSGARKGLCELFFTGHTDTEDGQNIYPRCFNIKEAKSWLETGCGIYGRMKNPFEDELSLYSHESFTELSGEFIGIVSAKYDIELIETTLGKKSCKKLSGLFLSPSENTIMQKLAINDRHIKEIYNPETILDFEKNYKRNNFTIVDNGIIYFQDKVILPEGIKIINDSAFESFSEITSIILPESLTKIGEYAFYECRSLHSIYLPNGLMTIGKSAFFGCCSLYSIYLPNNLSIIGASAFFGCSSLSSILLPNNLSKIEHSTFNGCSSLSSILLPNNLSKIEDLAFQFCSSLTSISLPNKLTKLGIGAFSHCSALNTISLSEELTIIEHSTFNDCSSLTSIELPNAITKIASYAFYNCHTLTSISLPDNLTEIGKEAFKNCNAINSIDLPNNLSKIGSSAFENCSSLKTIRLPNNLTNFWPGIFRDCTQLKTIENCPAGYSQNDLGVSLDCKIFYREEILQSIILPEGITEIVDGQFLGRKDITEIIIPNSVTKIGNFAFRNCTSLCTISLPDSLTEIGTEVFTGCFALTSISLPKNLTKIGLCAFAGCISLSSISFSPELTEIDNEAFAYCFSLTSVKLPDNIQRIGSNAFENCIKLKSIENCPKVYNHLELGVSTDCIISYQKELQKIIISNNITEISDKQFYLCKNIGEIIVPKNITKIGNSSFEYCSSLHTISLSPNLTKIGNNSFAYCSSLISINLPNSLIELGFSAFYNCTELRSISLSDNLSEICLQTFANCKSLISISLPDKLTKIGSGAFSHCSALNTISLSKELKIIDSWVFCDCSSLKIITIPEKTHIIGEYAFNNCASLKEITIPATVREIGDGAFAGCTGLREITISRRFEEDLQRIFTDVDLSEVKINWI